MKKNKLFGFLLLLITTLLFLIFIYNNFNNAGSYSIILVLLGISIFLIQKYNPLSANFLFFIMFAYSVGIGPIILLSQGVTYNYDFFRIILGGLLSFAWGSLFFSNTDAKEKIEEKSKIRFAVKRISFVRLLYLLSILASMLYLYKNKSVLFGGNLQSGRIEAASGSGIILYAMQLSIILIPIFYELYLTEGKNKKRIVTKFELLFVIVLSSIMLLFSGFRAPLVSMYICLIIVYVKRKNKNIIYMIPYGLAIILGVEALGIIRDVFSSSSTSINLLEKISTSLVVNCINLKYLFSYFPTKIPFQHGYTYIINILMLLPGPDLDFTLWLKEQLNLSFSGGGVTPTILGEFFINFGINSIYVGMFILGIVGNFITRYFEKSSHSFWGAFLIWQFAHCTSGGIANVMISIIIFSIVYWLIKMFPIEPKKVNHE